MRPLRLRVGELEPEHRRQAIGRLQGNCVVSAHEPPQAGTLDAGLAGDGRERAAIPDDPLPELVGEGRHGEIGVNCGSSGPLPELGAIVAVEVTATPSVNAVGTVADSVTAWRRDECSTKVLWPMGGVGPRS